MNHIFVDKILETTCVTKSGYHLIVKKAVQCQNCGGMADDTEHLMQSECKPEIPTLELLEGSTHEPTGKATPAPDAAHREDANRNETHQDLCEAKVQLEKLELLRKLEQERLQLQKLLAMKSGDVSFWAAAMLFNS